MKRLICATLAFLLFLTGFTWYRSGSKVQAAVPYNNSRVSVDGSGAQTNGTSVNVGGVSVSKDGQYVAFTSTSTDLVSGDTNGKEDAFVRNTVSGTTERVNLRSTGAEPVSGIIAGAEISANGRFVVFGTDDASTVPGDTNGKRDLFVRDRQLGTTEIVSVSSSSALGNGDVDGYGDISADGRYVVFASYASNLVSGDTNASNDVFVRDRKLNTTVLLSKSDAGVMGNNASYKPTISCDGSVVAFSSASSNLVASNSNGVIDAFVTQRVGGDSISNITQAGNAASQASDVSCDGSAVALYSDATNLVAGDTNSVSDSFVYDMYEATTDLITVSSGGAQANNSSASEISLSGDGRFAVFAVPATNLVSGDTNGRDDVFLRDRKLGVTERVSMRNASTQTTNTSNWAGISSDGKYIAYSSRDTGLVISDTNGREDVFLADSGTSVCAP